MANDGGVIAKIEQAMADALAALKVGEEVVFRTAAVWKYQVSADKGGLAAFEGYAPFAFVSYMPVSGYREGDGDLRQELNFDVAIGQVSKEVGVARTGDATHLGISKLRDYCLAALDNWHPGEGFDCDPFYYQDEIGLVDSPNIYAIQMRFKANLITL